MLFTAISIFFSVLSIVFAGLAYKWKRQATRFRPEPHYISADKWIWALREERKMRVLMEGNVRWLSRPYDDK